jgi:hypothetical protein
VPTLNLQVSASADDANSQSNATGSGGTGNVIAADITSTLLSPGSHGAGNFWYAGCRFLSVTIPASTTITSATFSLFSPSPGFSSAGTINLKVSCEKHAAAANPVTFATATGMTTTNRPRTTASVTWNQKTTASGAYESVDITSPVQEVLSQSGWTSGWSIVVIVEVDATTTAGEWQDYSSWDNADTNNPKLDIVYGGAASIFPLHPHAWRNPLLPQ